MTTKLSEIARISSGYPFRGKIPEEPGADSVVVQMKDTSAHAGIDWSGCLESTPKGKKQPQWLEPGNILVSARGNHNYAVLVTDAARSISKPAVAAPYFFILSDLLTCVNPEYLTWFLNQSPAQQYFAQSSEGSVTKSIKVSVIANTPIAIPTLQEQETIIRLVNIHMRERQLAYKLIENGEKMMSGIARDLLNKNHFTSALKDQQ